MKAKKQKLVFKPTPISRLRHYRSPIKMVGDPPWNSAAGGKTSWQSRERAVYQYEMERKSWPMAWSPEVWTRAQADNYRLDLLIRHKWDDYEWAWGLNAEFDYDTAIRENAAYDYHHDNFIAA